MPTLTTHGRNWWRIKEVIDLTVHLFGKGRDKDNEIRLFCRGDDAGEIDSTSGRLVASSPAATHAVDDANQVEVKTKRNDCTSTFGLGWQNPMATCKREQQQQQQSRPRC